MKKEIVLLIGSVLVLFCSCQKNIGPVFHLPGAPPGSNADTVIVHTNRELGHILEEVYQNDSAYREVLAAIFSGYYEDERVLLRDLLFPDVSAVYDSPEFLKWHTGRGIFKREFARALKSNKYPVVSEALRREQPQVVAPKALQLADQAVAPKTMQFADQAVLASVPTMLSGSTAVAIYFPYSGNFQDRSVASVASATIVAADREANSAPGRMPAACQTDAPAHCYSTVIVDDHYADLRPTHIVTNGATTAPAGTQPAPVVITRVYVGWTRLSRQMDALISFTGNGGGSEIKIARLSGYLKKESEQVTSFDGDLVILQFTRSEIARKQWKKSYTIWDPNWEKDNKEQVYAVYEDDTKGTKTFSGSLSTTLALPDVTGSNKSTNKTTGDISYKIEVSTQDDIITQRKLDRASFFAYGRSSAGWGFVGDQAGDDVFSGSWPVYDGGAIWAYSMPWQIR